MGKLTPNTYSLSRTQKIGLNSLMTSVLDGFYGGKLLCGPWARQARGRDEQRGKAGYRSMSRGVCLVVYRDPRPCGTITIPSP